MHSRDLGRCGEFALIGHPEAYHGTACELGPCSGPTAEARTGGRGWGVFGFGKFLHKVAQQCDVCHAFDKAPHLPIAGTSTAASSNGDLLADLLFLDSAIALRAMDVYPKYSLLITVCAGNPVEAWGPFCS